MVGVYLELSVFSTLAVVWFWMVLDVPTLHRPAALPAGFSLPESMRTEWPHHSMDFQTETGARLATYTWTPKDAPKALVFMLPGYGDHMDNSANIAQQLVDHGFAAFGMDPEGHGRSEGLRGYVRDFNQSVADALRWMRQVKGKYPKQTKKFLLGGSMGGALQLRVLLLAEKDEFDGVFLSAPAVSVSDNMYPWLRPLVKLAAQYVGHLPLTPPLSEDGMCLDEDVNIAIRADPLHYNGGIRPHSASEYLDNFAYLQAHLHEITAPMLIMHGEFDKIIPFAKSSELLKIQAASSDKTVIVLAGEYHNFLQSFKSKEYISQIIQWFEARL